MNLNAFRGKGKLETRELIGVEGVSPRDLAELLVAAKNLKTRARFGEKFTGMEGKNVLMMTKNAFGKARVTFELAVRIFGANPISLPLGGSEIEELMKSPESITVIGRLGIDLAVVDTAEASDAITLSRYLNIPVVNASDRSGPCHALAVLLTLWEKKGRLDGTRAVVVGEIDPSEASLIYALTKCGVDVKIVAPEETDDIRRAVDYARQFSHAEFSDSLESAVKGADAVYAFGHDFGSDYRLTEELVASRAPNALFFENIPLVRGKEADDELIDSPRSMIFEQGENLLHAERAAIYLLAK